jgi:hypothetical protein
MLVDQAELNRHGVILEYQIVNTRQAAGLDATGCRGEELRAEHRIAG